MDSVSSSFLALVALCCADKRGFSAVALLLSLQSSSHFTLVLVIDVGASSGERSHAQHQAPKTNSIMTDKRLTDDHTRREPVHETHLPNASYESGLVDWINLDLGIKIKYVDTPCGHFVGVSLKMYNLCCCGCSRVVCTSALVTDRDLECVMKPFDESQEPVACQGT